MFFKNLSNITIVFSILFLCSTTSNVNAMDGLIRQFFNLINGTTQSDNKVFSYRDLPVTEESFKQLRAIAFDIHFEDSFDYHTEASQDFRTSLYTTYKDEFHKDYAEATFKKTIALAKIVTKNIHSFDEKSIIVEHNNSTTKFTDGMALLLHDISTPSDN